MKRTSATARGFAAVLLWAFLAFLTVKAAPVPPFQLSAMAFLVGGVVGLVWMRFTGQPYARLWEIRTPVLLLGIGGLFGYHALYFSALRIAPAAEAGLIAYLWPLLIVLFSGFLPGESPKAGHLAGAFLSFTGAALLILQGGGGFSLQYLPGYVLAGSCALTWAAYSVLSRLAGTTPTHSVTLFCLAAAALSLGAHILFEETILPSAWTAWVSVAALGLGPVGLAFYLWDVGMKKGDIQTLGVAAYAAPLLSTFILVATGIAHPSGVLAVSALLITGGAALAARASRR
ncbi:MAG: DMT family transporter [Paracoccaceae bacterium]